MTSILEAERGPAATGAHSARRPIVPPRAVWGLAVTGLVAAVVAAPVIAVFAHAVEPTGGLWQHLADTVLADYVLNSLWLTIGVGGLSILLGTSCAWFVTMHEFPGRGWFEWALVLPLAMPAYVLAYAYTDLLQFTGPVPTALRDAMGWGAGDYWFPEIRSVGGAVFVLAAALYPYVYVVARAAFLEQS